MSDSITLDDLPQPDYEGRVSVDDLSTDGENPNSMSDEQFGLLVDRMRKEGWLGGPILTDTDGLIADGEHRWRAAQELGLDEVPVRQYEIDDAERRLYRQEMNKNQGEHDSKRDALEYDYLLNNGMADEVQSLTRAADEDLDELLEEIKLQGDRPPAYEYDPEHNVYFEDCVEGMRERLDDNSVDCVITDPPYGVDYGGGRGNREFDLIQNDSDVAGAVELFREVLGQMSRVLKNDGHAFIFTRWDVYPDFYATVKTLFEIEDCGVWAKNNWGMGHSQTGFRPQHEFIIHAHTGDARPLTSQSSDLFEYNRTDTSDYDHPTQKPVPLVSRLAELATYDGDTVLDPFIGSGTTAVAAIQNDRDYVGFEIDEENYRDVIERRIGEAKRAKDSSVNNPETAEADD